MAKPEAVRGQKGWAVFSKSVPQLKESVVCLVFVCVGNPVDANSFFGGIEALGDGYPPPPNTHFLFIIKFILFSLQYYPPIPGDELGFQKKGGGARPDTKIWRFCTHTRNVFFSSLWSLWGWGPSTVALHRQSHVMVLKLKLEYVV